MFKPNSDKGSSWRMKHEKGKYQAREQWEETYTSYGRCENSLLAVCLSIGTSQGGQELTIRQSLKSAIDNLGTALLSS